MERLDTSLITQNHKFKLVTVHNYLRVTVERTEKKNGKKITQLHKRKIKLTNKDLN